MTIQEIKKDFFSFRNGIVAKTFLDSGYPYKHIYGLQLPQLTQIAVRIGMPSHELAKELWNDRECRESRLLSLWLFDRELLSRDELKSMIADVKTREEADMLAFKVLKRMPDAREILEDPELFGEGENLSAYVKEALRRNLE